MYHASGGVLLDWSLLAVVSLSVNSWSPDQRGFWLRKVRSPDRLLAGLQGGTVSTLCRYASIALYQGKESSLKAHATPKAHAAPLLNTFCTQKPLAAPAATRPVEAEVPTLNSARRRRAALLRCIHLTVEISIHYPQTPVPHRRGPAVLNSNRRATLSFQTQHIPRGRTQPQNT